MTKKKPVCIWFILIVFVGQGKIKIFCSKTIETLNAKAQNLKSLIESKPLRIIDTIYPMEVSAEKGPSRALVQRCFEKLYTCLNGSFELELLD